MKKIFGKSILLIALSILSIDVFAQQYRSFTLDNALSEQTEYTIRCLRQNWYLMCA